MSGKRNVLIPQRHRANSFAGRREVGVEHGGRRDADRRLADTAPEAAARHDDRLNLRHLADPHRIVGIEVRLLDTAVLDGAPAIEQPRQAVDKRAGDLAFDLRRIDGIARIGGGNNAMDLDLVAACGAGWPQPIFSATALSTARCFGCFVISLRRNSTGSWPTE